MSVVAVSSLVAGRGSVTQIAYSAKGVFCTQPLIIVHNQQYLYTTHNLCTQTISMQEMKDSIYVIGIYLYFLAYNNDSFIV